MGEMKLFIVLILCVLHLSLVCTQEKIECQELALESGDITDSAASEGELFAKHQKCWTIQVPADSNVILSIEYMKFSSMLCAEAYIEITFDATPEKFCEEDRGEITITASNDVTITYFHDSTEKSSSFALKYQRRTQEKIECQELALESGDITDSAASAGELFVKHLKCWTIKVPEDSNVILSIEYMKFNSMPCTEAYIEITSAATPETFCEEDKQEITRTAYNDVTITYFHDSTAKSSSFALKYQRQTSISTISGVNTKRQEAFSWIFSKQLPSYGWDQGHTPRVVTTLFLGGYLTFKEGDPKENLIKKQLEIRITMALLRNSADSLSVSELTMFVNALRVECYNPRNFYGYDLVQMLSDRMTKSNSPAAYLALCSANGTIAENNVRSLLKNLEKKPVFPFHADIQAMTVMALSCMKNKTKVFETDKNAPTILNTAIKNLMTSQSLDGSFSKLPTTTAVITQALLSSGQEKSNEWNVKNAVKYLVNQDPSSIDFISTSLVLPIFNQKTQADITTTHCKNQIMRSADRKLFEAVSKIGPKKQIEYNLYIGDKKDITHVMFLRIPDTSSALDVMQAAGNSDPKFKFSSIDLLDQKYVYKIGEIINDPLAEKYWHFYFGWSSRKDRIALRTESPDKVNLKGGDLVVMWYKTPEV